MSEPKKPWSIGKAALVMLLPLASLIGLVYVIQSNHDAQADTHNAKLRREFVDDLNVRMRGDVHVSIDIFTTSGEYDDVLVMRALPCDRTTLRGFLVGGLAQLATQNHFYAVQCADGSARLLKSDDWR